MTYKLLAVDVDGTLLNSNNELTKTTKLAIQAAVDRGIIFVISSGRPLQAVSYFTKLIGIDTMPFIIYNGAMVVTGDTKTVIYKQELLPDDARTVLALGKTYGTTMIIWSDHKLYVSEFNDRVKNYQKLTPLTPSLMPDPEDLISQGITKILWYDSVEQLAFYQSELKGLLAERINYHTSKPEFLEFVDKRASKAIAMEKLGEFYHIKPSEMIAVGDGFNDLSMIEYAGLGVAMENAPDEIKKAADYVTLSNNKDGVAAVINKFLLNDVH